MAVNIVLTNQKGGVGKTTTAASLAAGLVMEGKRVLALDLDPQGNLGFSLGLNADAEGTIYDLMKGNVDIREIICPTEYGDIIPSDITLSAGVKEFYEKGRESLLKEALSDIGDEYDYIIIDTPPALNILTINAYVASDYIIVPMSSEILSLVGLTQLKETVDSVRLSLNQQIRILGILLTKFNSRTRLANEVKEMAESVALQMDTALFDNKIRSSVSVSEMPAHGMSIFKYAPRSKPAEDYLCFVREVIERIG